MWRDRRRKPHTAGNTKGVPNAEAAPRSKSEFAHAKSRDLVELSEVEEVEGGQLETTLLLVGLEIRNTPQHPIGRAFE